MQCRSPVQWIIACVAGVRTVVQWSWHGYSRCDLSGSAVRLLSVGIASPGLSFWALTLSPFCQGWVYGHCLKHFLGSCAAGLRIYHFHSLLAIKCRLASPLCFCFVQMAKKRKLRTPSPVWQNLSREQRQQWIACQEREHDERKDEILTAPQRRDRTRMWREHDAVAASGALEETPGAVVGAERFEGDGTMKQLAREWEMSRWVLTQTLATFNPLQFTRLVCGRPVQVVCFCFLKHE